MSLPEPAGGRILVVDDYEGNRALAQDILEEAGYSVLPACSGYEALEIAAGQTVDLVLLDMRMPEMDGIATCLALRQQERMAEVPIVFLTAQDDKETHERAQACGADDFLAKPVRATELLIRVRALLRLRQLTRELRGAYAVVVQQRDGLQRSVLLQRELASFVVHDLKNPISRILLATNFIATKDQQSRDMLLHVEEAARTLSRMVHELLDVARSETESLPALRRPTNILTLSADVVRVMGRRALDASGKTRLSVEGELGAPVVAVDPDLVRRVLENLVGNAILYGPADGQIVIALRNHAALLEIRVSDEGRGIPQEERERIFEKFVQLDAGDRSESRVGHGLGLAFCKAAAHAHGGTIGVEDGPGGKGCVFVLRLPQNG